MARANASTSEEETQNTDLKRRTRRGGEVGCSAPPLLLLLLLTSSVGGVHSLCRQTELAEERAELPGGQGAAEHAHGLKETESH